MRVGDVPMKSVMKPCLTVVLVAGVSLLGRVDAQQTQDKALQITLIRVQPDLPKPIFRVELHNTGEQPLILNLGMMLANGKQQYADAVTLVLTDNHGKTTPLKLLGPAYVAGRIDPLVVPLPKGATFTLPVNLTDYISPKNNLWQVTLAPGDYTISAAYAGVGVPQQGANLDMQGISLMPYWTGAVRSNAVTFMVSKTVDYPIGNDTALSIGFALAADTRTKTSPGPAKGSAKSSHFKFSGLPYSCSTTAFIAFTSI